MKVHGQMVDPQAVEHALTALPDVREAVVSPVPALDGGTRLVAHVLPEGDAQLRQRDLRLALAEQLPPFMIPSVFIQLDAIPRNTRGKVDRAALRETALGAAPVEVEYTPPRDEHEQVLADILTQILGVERVGVQDNIFELGADSLSVTEFLAAIHDRFGANLQYGTLVESLTVEALARRLVTPADHRTVVPLHSGGTGRPFFCVTGARGGVLALRPLARRLDRPAYSFVPRGFDKPALPDRSVKRAAARYIEALRTVQPSGPYFVG